MTKFGEPPASAKMIIRHALQFSRPLRFVWQSAKGWTIASGLVLTVQGLLPLLTLYLMKLIVDAVITGLAAPDKRAVFGRILFLICFMGIAALLAALARFMASIANEAQAQAVADHMNDVIHAKSIEVDLEYYESAQYYDTLHRAQKEAYFRPTRIVNGLMQIGQNAISLLAMAGLLFSLHWVIAAVLFVAVVPGIAVQLRYAGKMYRWKREMTSMERQAGYFSWILTNDYHAKEIRLFGLGPLFIKRFRDLSRKLRRGMLKISAGRSLSEFIAQASATVAIYGSYAFIAYRAVHGDITMGGLVMYFQAFQRGQGFLQEILNGLAGLYHDSLFISNIYEFLDLKRKVVEPAHPIPIPQTMQSGIVFDHVNFQYPGGNRKVLEDVTFSIKPGEVVALVGENGSGKTTLIKLLCRLYDPTSGAIILDGTDLREFHTTALRREIAVIFQDYAQYHLTARENIWFGDTSLPADHEHIVSAARRAGADGVINRLPRGYDTPLGKGLFEDGEELSIGEWQKIALARAFARDAQIVVLDEPTSSMGARAEYEVFRNFREHASGRTVILISHRFSTVRMADRIYVLEGGRITEGGAHDELVRAGGTYARLFEIQARHYR